ncbi:MAG: GGDEF domain-containing protein [Treponema sp.]|nr:GGDEF domain-containing protein [Treponema sp.]
MSKVFVNNLNSLRQANLLVVFFTAFFAAFHVLIDLLPGKEITFFNFIAYIITGLLAFGFYIYLNYKMQVGEVSNRFIYLFTTLFFVNIMTFGIYHCVWFYDGHIAAFYLCILICALLMFINPPLFNLGLTLSAMIALVIFSVLRKAPELAILDVFNTIAAGVLSLFFSWHITKLRLGMEISANVLEDERNKYLDQSIIDELTKLNNRRDFMATFKRYVNNYRTSDDFLCIAISDIDFFKNYNDHYGHPQGDECLRVIGAAFNKLKDTMGVYAARVGGEEFGMLWFEKDASHVDAVVSYMSSLIRNAKIPHEKSKVSDYVTMSIGVYVEKLGESHDIDALYELADNALYAAKGAGRNCAIINGRDSEQYKITPPA